MNAVVKYELSRSVDHEGGRSLLVAGSWVNVNDFQVSNCLCTLSVSEACLFICIYIYIYSWIFNLKLIITHMPTFMF